MYWDLTNNPFTCSVRIPWTDPSGESIILPSAEFERITSASRVLTKEEREALKDAYQRKKQEEIVRNKTGSIDNKTIATSRLLS